jgi:hypothetical protein
MSFLSALKKVGQIAGAVSAPIMIGFGVPPTVADAVAAGVSEASAFDGATNEQKKAHVMNIAKDAIQAVNGQAGHAEVDEASTLDAVDKGVNTAFDVAHIIHASHQEDAAEQAAVQTNQSTGAILEKASVLSQQRSVVTDTSVSSVHPDFKE